MQVHTNQGQTSRSTENHPPIANVIAATHLSEGFFDAHPKEIQALNAGELPIYKEVDDHVETYPDHFGVTSDEELGAMGQALVEFAGRACYQSFSNPSGRTNAEYIANIKKQKHFSVLEHTNVTFYFEHTDRAVTHEFIRHRHFSYSQLSQRYVDSSKTSAVVPPLYRQDHELGLEFQRAVELSQRAYEVLVKLSEQRHPGLKRKQIREAARRVLPEATETKIVVTGNLRAWYEFLTKRYSVAADASILEVAELVRKKLAQMYPAVFGDVELQTY